MPYSLLKLGTLLKRLSIVFLLFQLSRLLFFFYNKHHFQEINTSALFKMLAGGFRFDLTAILYLNLLYIILYLIPWRFEEKKNYKKLQKYLFVATNSLGLAFNLIDVFYFNYVLKRSTVEIFMFTGEANIGTLFVQFAKDFWWGFLVFGLFVYIIIKWYDYIKAPYIKPNYRVLSVLSGLALLLVSLYFSVVGIRGGFTRTTRPISINNAGAYISKPLEMAIVLNTPFTLIRTINKKAFKPVHYFPDNEVDKIFTPVMHFSDSIAMQKKNVMIIIVESLAREYTGLLNKGIPNYQGYTPFLDSLMLQSHTFTNAYANGRKSIDAMPSVLTSIPSLVQPFVLSPYATNKVNGLGKILQKEGYETAFFHGAPNGSMGFDAFANLAGFKHYFGANDYGNASDFDGFWGVPDDKFLQYTAKQLDTFKQPFAVSLFTLSSHHPFKLPKGFEHKFAEGKLPIHKVIRYTDYALKHFFETARKTSWYQNTIFVITADHCNQTYLPQYNNIIGRYAVPIIIFDPAESKLAKLDSTLTQQVDIIPKLMRKLHYSGNLVSFGNDPKSSSEPFVVNYTNGTWYIMQADYLLEFRNDESISLYNFKKDSMFDQNIIKNEQARAKKMAQLLKAFIQQYKNRLIENKLT